MIVGKANRREHQVGDGEVDANSERRSANHPEAIVRPVIDSIVEAVVDSPIVESPVTRRQVVDSVAVEVRMVAIEVAGTVIRQEITLPRRDPVDVPVLADPHEIITGFTHHVVSAARHVLVIRSKTVPGGIANPLGLPSGVVGRTACDAAPGRRSDRPCDPLAGTAGRGPFSYLRIPGASSRRTSGGGGGTPGRGCRRTSGRGGS